MKTGGVIHILGVVYRWGEKEGKLCFLLVMYGFGNSNALYTLILSFTMFILLLTPINTWDCWFRSIPSLLLLVKVLRIKRHMTLFLVSYLWRNNCQLWANFCFSCILLGWCCQNKVRSREFWKKYNINEETFCTLFE